MPKARDFVAAVIVFLLLFASVQASAQSITPVNLKTLPDTIGLEHSDRMARLGRLAKLYGVTKPEIDELQLASGQISGIDYPVPVVRILFDEGVFFDFDKDQLQPQGQKIIEIMAQSLMKDVPDVKLLVFALFA